MFSIRVHLPDTPGHTMYECVGYTVKPNKSGVMIVMKKKDDTTQELQIVSGGCAYVMGDTGKTVDTVRPDGVPRTAQLRGGR